MKAQIARMSSHTDLTLDQDSANLLKCACIEYAIDPDARNRIIAIARTIANLDRSERIGPVAYLRGHQLPSVSLVSLLSACLRPFKSVYFLRSRQQTRKKRIAKWA